MIKRQEKFSEPVRRARTPAADRIAQADAARRQAETSRMARDGGFEIAPRLALEKIAGRGAAYVRAAPATQRACAGLLLLAPRLRSKLRRSTRRRACLACARTYDRRRATARRRRPQKESPPAVGRVARRSRRSGVPRKTRASRSDAPCGIVSTASRAANRTRKVKRRALGRRLNATTIDFAGVSQNELGRARVGRGLFAQEAKHGAMLTQNMAPCRDILVSRAEKIYRRGDVRHI